MNPNNMPGAVVGDENAPRDVNEIRRQDLKQAIDAEPRPAVRTTTHPQNTADPVADEPKKKRRKKH